MTTPSKKKGTGGETELVRLLNKRGLKFRRTPASHSYDLVQEGSFATTPIEALATRPDHGEWLVTMRLDDFSFLLLGQPRLLETHVEVKRYARFSLHSIFAGKFPRSRSV